MNLWLFYPQASCLLKTRFSLSPSFFSTNPFNPVPSKGMIPPPFFFPFLVWFVLIPTRLVCAWWTASSAVSARSYCMGPPCFFLACTTCYSLLVPSEPCDFFFPAAVGQNCCSSPHRSREINLKATLKSRICFCVNTPTPAKTLSAMPFEWLPFENVKFISISQ